MATIITIQSSDLITNSRADINTSLANLNSDKIETSVLDTDTALAANSDSKVATQKAVKTYIDTSGGANASETVRGIVEEATDAEVTAGTATGGTGAKLFVSPAKLATRLKFGGTGADGALTITSGTTTIDLGSAAVVTKNYTSISITGTGVLGFSNPHAAGTIVILKSQGAVAITSSTTPCVDLRSMGCAGGAVDTSAASPTGLFTATPNPRGLVGALTVGGVGGTALIPGPYTFSSDHLHRKAIFMIAGAGGGGGVQSQNTATAGGRGGGALLIQCGGALNFTGVINSSGATAASVDGAASAISGAGGGGGAGQVVILYNSLTANSGTITATGGAGGGVGSSTNAAGDAGGGGGGGGALGSASTGGTGANGGASPSAGGAAAGVGAGGGGAGGGDGNPGTAAGGAGGASMGGLVALNTELD